MTSDGPVTLTLLSETARFSLRVGPNEALAAAKALGGDLPGRIGDGTMAGQRSAICLGPDEWVLHTVPEDAAALHQAFAEIYAAAPHSLVEIGDREQTIALSGLQAVDLLSTGCPRDVEALQVGCGVRTVFDTVQVVLIRDGETAFRLEVAQSYLPHVWALLSLANREFTVS
jgi:sarcosine oxidase subunit gamma